MRSHRAVLGLVLAFAGGCGSSEEFGPDSTWTVVVYGHGDHNLSPALARDINEMKAATLRGNVNVLVLADWNGSETGFSTGGEWLRITDGQAAVIESIAEQDLDDPNVLAAAVERGFMLAPADRHALILWDHGGGWEGGYGGDTADGSQQGPGIMMPVVADAVRAGLDGASIDKLDVFAFDTCLLGGAESAAEFVGVSSLYIANGELDYGDGLDYRALLTYLSDQPGTGLAALASADASAYGQHHSGELIDRMLHAHVALDLERMPAVMDRAADVVSSIDTPDAALAVARAMFSAAPGYYNNEFSPDGTRAPGLHDIGQVADVLAESGAGNVASAARGLRDSLDDLIVADSLGELRATAQVGMNVELTPPIDATSVRLAEYESKAPAWNNATGWSSLIDAVASFGDDTAPRVSGQVAADGSTIQFQVLDADIADVTFELGDLDGDVEYGYGWVAAGAVPAQQPFDMTWSGDVWAMSTSAGLEAVYVEPWALSYAPDGAPTYGMMFTPGIIEGGDEELAMLMFDPDTGNAPLFTIWNAASETWTTKAVDEYRGRSFAPIIPVWDATGASDVLRLDRVAISGGDLVVEAGSMTPGTYRVNLLASDVWGNESLLPLDVRIGAGVATQTRATRRTRGQWLREVIAADRAGTLGFHAARMPANRAGRLIVSPGGATQRPRPAVSGRTEGRL